MLFSFCINNTWERWSVNLHYPMIDLNCVNRCQHNCILIGHDACLHRAGEYCCETALLGCCSDVRSDGKKRTWSWLAVCGTA